MKLLLQSHIDEVTFNMMYYKNIAINTFKYIRALEKSTCILKNVSQLSFRKYMFIKYLFEINALRNYNPYQWKSSSQNKIFAVSGSFLFNLFSSKEEKDDIEELTMTIKRSILLIQKEEYVKAEQMLHIALRQAQILQHYNGITYIYDIMANLAYAVNDFKKAELLFKSVLKRLIDKGVPQDDLAVIHISIKIADIYEKIGDTENAYNGYKFCLQHLQNHRTKDNENHNVLTLLGLTLEKYASMLFLQLDYANALKHFIQAYEISIKINGENHEQTVVLLNDLGTVNYMLEKYDKAIEYLSKAAELGKNMPDMVDLGSIHVNLGNTLIAKGLHEEARKSCSEGYHIAKIRGDDDCIREAQKCLEKITKIGILMKS